MMFSEFLTRRWVSERTERTRNDRARRDALWLTGVDVDIKALAAIVSTHSIVAVDDIAIAIALASATEATIECDVPETARRFFPGRFAMTNIAKIRVVSSDASSDHEILIGDVRSLALQRRMTIRSIGDVLIATSPRPAEQLTEFTHAPGPWTDDAHLVSETSVFHAWFRNMMIEFFYFFLNFFSECCSDYCVGHPTGLTSMNLWVYFARVLKATSFLDVGAGLGLYADYVCRTGATLAVAVEPGGPTSSSDCVVRLSADAADVDAIQQAANRTTFDVVASIEM